MATVTGYTAARTQEIEDSAIVDGNVDGSGHLILVRHDLTEIDAGSVIGPPGGAGPTGPTSIVICTSATRPTGGSLFAGLYIYETDTKLTYVWDGAAWKYRGGTIICTSGTRPSNPIIGLPIYETDTQKHLIWNGVRFDPPWNQPWGILDYKEKSANQTVTGTPADAVDLTSTLTYVANRRIRITEYHPAYFGPSAAEVATVWLKEGGTFLQYHTFYQSGGQTGSGGLIHILSPSAGSHTYRIVLGRSIGSQSWTFESTAAGRASLLIEDLGPNGAPV